MRRARTSLCARRWPKRPVPGWPHRRCWWRYCGPGWAWSSRRTRCSPEASVGFVGVARDEETALPTPYLESLPDDLRGRPVIVLDPMLATGGSMTHTIDLLHRRGADDITVLCVVAAPEGIAALEKTAPQRAAVHRGHRRRSQRCRLHRARSRRRRRPPVRTALNYQALTAAASSSRSAAAWWRARPDPRRPGTGPRCRT